MGLPGTYGSDFCSKAATASIPILLDADPAAPRDQRQFAGVYRLLTTITPCFSKRFDEARP
jgi:hypothetical protein